MEMDDNKHKEDLDWSKLANTLRDHEEAYEEGAWEKFLLRHPNAFDASATGAAGGSAAGSSTSSSVSGNEDLDNHLVIGGADPRLRRLRYSSWIWRAAG